MEKQSKKNKINCIIRKGIRKWLFDLLVKQMGAIGYVIQGLIDGLFLHIVFWIVQFIEGLFVVNNTMIVSASKLVGILDYASIIICTIVGIINYVIHSYYDTKREQVKENSATQKIKNKYESLPGKTAEIAEKLASDINSIEVEDDPNE